MYGVENINDRDKLLEKYGFCENHPKPAEKSMPTENSDKPVEEPWPEPLAIIAKKSNKKRPPTEEMNEDLLYEMVTKENTNKVEIIRP